MCIPETEQEIKKIFFVFWIIGFELGAAKSHSSEEDTCHRQSMY